MILYKGEQTIKQLEKRKGGYFYLQLNRDIVNEFIKKKATRVICYIDYTISYRCGLNHLGDGNFFIIVAGKYLKSLNKTLGDTVYFQIDEDPDQLGVDMPEVLTVFLAQDVDDTNIFNALTNGKKRSLIYSIVKIKNIDRQVKIIQDFLKTEKVKQNA